MSAALAAGPPLAQPGPPQQGVDPPLKSFHVPAAQIPAHLHGRIALYRTALAEQRVTSCLEIWTGLAKIVASVITTPAEARCWRQDRTSWRTPRT